MMGNLVISLALLQSICYSSCNVFLHEPSNILITPSNGGAKSEFGFTMGYQHGDRPKLVIGAPRDTYVGKVFDYPMGGSLQDVTNHNVTCSSVDIDLEKLADTNRDAFPDQNYYFGGSILGSKDYFMACAPLITSKIKLHSKRNYEDLFGTCIVYNETAYRYNGSLEQYVQDKKSKIKLKTFIGGAGWSTLVDEVNGLLIIMKTGLTGDITFVPLQDPLKPTISVKQKLKDKDVLELFINENNNIGFGLTSGNYFSNETIYAYSVQTREMFGAVAFLTYNKVKNNLETVRQRKKVLVIPDSNIGSMFGTVLCSADLNMDGFSDLLIGAPSHTDIPEESETGAVHIFIGGTLNATESMVKRRMILGIKEFGQFGAAIATSDIDGDGYPEIFIGAPYEDSGSGTLYVLSGNEVYDKLLRCKTFEKLLITELIKTQIIRSHGLSRFGYSLQVIPDRDSNGCDELAVGAPGSGAVVLYRCLPTIKVTVSTKLLGGPIVKETANDFMMEVCVKVNFSSKHEAIYSQLVVTTNVGIGDKAKTQKPTYFIDIISPKQENNCENVTVILGDNEPGVYTFKAHVNISTKMTTNIYNNTNFSNKWAILSPQSKTEDVRKIPRNCGDDCQPIWNVTLEWSGNKDSYDLGSEDPALMIATVRNYGSSSSGSCLLFHVAGAEANITSLGCIKYNGFIKCDLTSPFLKNHQDTINIDFNMNGGSNLDQELYVVVKLYENCDQPQFDEDSFVKTTSLTIPYNLMTNRVKVIGSEIINSFTDQELLDVKNQYIHNDNEYVIDNSGSITWKHIGVVLVVFKKKFMHDVSLPDEDADHCIKEDKDDFYSFNCTYTLEAGSRRRIMVTMEISKATLMDYVVDNKFNTTSNLVLHLQPTNDEKIASAHSVFYFKKELTLSNDITMIILLGILVAFVVLTIIILILYKLNFFKRKEKKNLAVLRESIRRHSVKKSTSSSKPRSSATDDLTVMDLAIGEDSPFGEPTNKVPPIQEVVETTDDEIVLIEEKAQVHC